MLSMEVERLHLNIEQTEKVKELLIRLVNAIEDE